MIICQVLEVPQLRRIRLDQALSQYDLAKRARVARTTIMRAEQGARLRPASVRKLAQALRVKPSDLQRSD
jgi:transcriptional regulator with XRE-family HTH domain